MANKNEFKIGEVVHDTHDDLLFVVSGIADGPYIAAEHGIYGFRLDTGEFHWNFIQLTEKVKKEV